MERLPSISEVRNSIQILQTEVWPAFEDFKTVNEYMAYFHQKFAKHFNKQMLYFSKPVVNPAYKFYRVRPLGDWDISAVQEHSYPPSNFCRKNRANLPGHPVFYSSPNPSTALLETIRNNKLDVDKTYCLSMWTLKKRNQPFIVSPFILNVEDERYKKVSEKILTDRLKESLKNSPHSGDMESFRAILEYLSSSFVHDDEQNYSISSFIGHSHLYMPHQVRTDLFIYPSIQSSMKAVNIAINPKTVDESLMMKYLLILNVTDLDMENNHIQFAVSHFGIADDKKNIIKPSGDFETGPDATYLEILKEFTSTL